MWNIWGLPRLQNKWFPSWWMLKILTFSYTDQDFLFIFAGKGGWQVWTKTICVNWSCINSSLYWSVYSTSKCPIWKRIASPEYRPYVVLCALPLYFHPGWLIRKWLKLSILLLKGSYFPTQLSAPQLPLDYSALVSGTWNNEEISTFPVSLPRPCPREGLGRQWWLG